MTKDNIRKLAHFKDLKQTQGEATNLLIEVARQYNDYSAKKEFERVKNCCGVIETRSDNKILPFRCKSRVCVICNEIKAYEYFYAYLDLVYGFSNPRFLTLTSKTISSSHVSKTFKKLSDHFKLILRRGRERAKREGIEYGGMRCFEMKFNYQSGLFNPHVHILTRNKRMAEIFIEEWLNKFGDNAKAEFQTISPVKKDDLSLKILFKYMHKGIYGFITDYNLIKLSPEMFYHTYKASKKVQLYQSFGLGKKPLQSKNMDDSDFMDLYGFDPNSNTWLNDNGTPLI